MRYRNFIIILISTALYILTGTSTFAQQDKWKERMESEKIAFLTIEIGLTPEEAQIFWPVYNKVREQLDKAMHETFASYKELEKALETNKTDKEISRCLDNYLNAMDKQDKVRNSSVEEYKKILPDKKVARIFIAEEKFRRQHIRKLHFNPRPQQERKQD